MRYSKSVEIALRIATACNCTSLIPRLRTLHQQREVEEATAIKEDEEEGDEDSADTSSEEERQSFTRRRSGKQDPIELSSEGKKQLEQEEENDAEEQNVSIKEKQGAANGQRTPKKNVKQKRQLSTLEQELLPSTGSSDDDHERSSEPHATSFQGGPQIGFVFSLFLSRFSLSLPPPSSFPVSLGFSLLLILALHALAFANSLPLPYYPLFLDHALTAWKLVSSSPLWRYPLSEKERGGGRMGDEEISKDCKDSKRIQVFAFME